MSAFLRTFSAFDIIVLAMSLTSIAMTLNQMRRRRRAERTG